MKRFLTQALVDHQSIARHHIWDQAAWHRLIWEAFNPVEGDRGPRRFLYSIGESSSLRGDVPCLILSDEIPTRPEWCPAQGWVTKPVPDGFLKHQRYVFGLTASATRILTTDGRKQRVSLAKRLTPEDESESRLLDWLERKGSDGGFRIIRSKTNALPLDVQNFTNSRKQQITLQYTRFTGVLDVTDHQLFTSTFNTGIGRAKSYGAGLLLLKPIQ